MVQYSMARYVSGVCVYISKRTNWAMQLFNLHVIHFNMIRGEGGERKSFLSYYNRMCVHSRPLEDRSQQLPFDWRQRMIPSKLGEEAAT